MYYLCLSLNLVLFSPAEEITWERSRMHFDTERLAELLFNADRAFDDAQSQLHKFYGHIKFRHNDGEATVFRAAENRFKNDGKKFSQDVVYF